MNRRIICLGVFAGFWLLAGIVAADGVERLWLVARDVDDRLLAGFRFAYGASQTLPTSPTRATDLELPEQHVPGQPIKLFLLAGPADGQEWFLVNPLVNVAARESAVEVT